VTFHNGEPFNAETVVWNVERVIEPGFQDYAYLSPMSGAEVVDEYTVRIFTDDVLPTFPGLLAQFLMVPSQYITEMGVEGFTQAPVGTGPYEFVDWDPGTFFEVEANEDYWNDAHAPTYRSVRWRVIPESGGRVAGLLAGEVDIVKDLPSDDFDRIDADSNLDALWTRSIRTPFIGIYPDSPKTGAEPFADVRVRRAVNHAVNVDVIIEALLGGRAFRTATLMTPDFPGYLDLEPYEYDPERARELLAEAGYPDGFEVTFETWTAGPAPKPLELTQVLASQLEQVGVSANIVPNDLSTAFANQQGGTLSPLFLWSWGGGQIDCRDKVWGVFHPDSSASMLTTDEVVEAIDRLEVTVDQEERNAICEDLQRMIHEQALIIPLFAQGDTYGMRSELSWSPRPDELILPWEVQPE
jgi:peptide/nickel transport system substrate-binding protein